MKKIVRKVMRSKIRAILVSALALIMLIGSVPAVNVFAATEGVECSFHWIDAEDVGVVSGDKKTVTFDREKHTSLDKAIGEVVLALDGSRDYAAGEIKVVLSIDTDSAYNPIPGYDKENGIPQILFNQTELNRIGFNVEATSETTVTITNTKAIENVASTYNLGFTYEEPRRRHLKSGVPVRITCTSTVGDAQIINESISYIAKSHVSLENLEKTRLKGHYNDENLSYGDITQENYFFVDWLITGGDTCSDLYHSTFTENPSNGGILVDVLKGNTGSGSSINFENNAYTQDVGGYSYSAFSNGVEDRVVRVAYPRTIPEGTRITNSITMDIVGYQSDETASKTATGSFIYYDLGDTPIGQLYKFEKQRANSTALSLDRYMNGLPDDSDIYMPTKLSGIVRPIALSNPSFAVIDDLLTTGQTPRGEQTITDQTVYRMESDTFKLTFFTGNDSSFKAVINEDYSVVKYVKLRGSIAWIEETSDVNKNDVIAVKRVVNILNPDITKVEYDMRVIVRFNKDTLRDYVLEEVAKWGKREIAFTNIGGLRVFDDGKPIETLPFGTVYNRATPLVQSFNASEGYTDGSIWRYSYAVDDSFPEFTHKINKSYTSGVGDADYEYLYDKYKSNLYGYFKINLDGAKLNQLRFYEFAPSNLYIPTKTQDFEAWWNRQDVQDAINLLCSYADYEDLKIAEYLPPEFDVDSIRIFSPTRGAILQENDYDIVKNYDNSGRTAIIIDGLKLITPENIKQFLQAYCSTNDIDNKKLNSLTQTIACEEIYLMGGVYDYNIFDSSQIENIYNFVRLIGTDPRIVHTGSTRTTGTMPEFEEGFSDYLDTIGHGITDSGTFRYGNIADFAVGSSSRSLVSQSGYTKRVTTDTDKYEMKSVVDPSAEYFYTLSLNNSSSQWSKDIVFFDSIENHKDSQWRGIFKEVDTTFLDKHDLPYTIYYSTKDLDFSVAQNTDLTNASIWSTTMPEASSVKSVAIDMKKTASGDDFVLGPQQKLVVNINMTAVDGIDIYVPKYTYNIASISSSTSANGSDYTATQVRAVQPTELKLNIARETINVPVTKEWKGDENTLDKRPETIKITLYRNGESYDDVTLSADDLWKHTFTKLPKFDENGQEYKYTIDEDTVTDYKKSINGYKITNTYDSPKGSVKVRYITEDGELLFPTDGEWSDVLKDSVAGTAYTTEKKTFTNYEFKEMDKDSASANGTVVADTTLYVTYVYRMLTGSVDVVHKTVDGEILKPVEDVKKDVPVGTPYETNQETFEDYHFVKLDDASDPASGKVEEGTKHVIYLYEHDKGSVDVVYKTIDGTILKGVEWVAKDVDTKTPYTTEQLSFRGYRFVKLDDASDPASGKVKKETQHVIYLYEPNNIDIPVSKTWSDADNNDGKRPDSVTIKLLANGNDIGKTLTLNADNEWSDVFADLPAEDENGDITYTIEELPVTDYEAKIEGNAADGFVVTNTHEVERVTLNGMKIWDDDDNNDGKRPESITVNLLADGEIVDTVTVTAENDWKYSFTELPKYKEGKAISYTIDEEDVSDYEKEIDGLNLINTHISEKIKIEGIKTWVDEDNFDGLRPESITVRVFANGEEIRSAVVTTNSYEFADLPKYKSGEEIVYTITEDEVTGYTSKVDGFSLTNTHVVEKVTVEGTKTWDDANNQDGIRPESITVKLLANGEAIDEKEVSGDFTYKFEELPKYKDGKEIAYTIEEVAVDGYETTYDGYNITNKHVPEVVSVEGTKTWDDEDDKDSIRPEEITVRLFADGEEIDSTKVSKSTEWRYIFSNLPKFKEGVEIAYTITEDEVEGYETEINGFDIVNKHTPKEEPKPEPNPEPEEPEEAPKPEEPKEQRNPSLATTVTAGNVRAGENGAIITFNKNGVSVVDEVRYKDLIAGGRYILEGALVKVDGNEVITTATKECIAESSEGIWTLEFGNVVLEAGVKYVVFESAYSADGKDVLATKESPIEHKDIDDMTQTIIVEGEVAPDNADTKPEVKKTAPNITRTANITKQTSAVNTGDTNNILLYVGIILVSGIIITVVLLKKKKEKK